MASNIVTTEVKSDTELKINGTSSESGVTTTISEGSAPQANQRHMWQIFTDDSGEIQRKATPVQIVENPFNGSLNSNKTNPFNTIESEQTNFTLPNGFANPNAHDITNSGGGKSDERPPKPKRITVENGRVGSTAKQQVSMSEDKVVFEADTTYTRFDNVDEHEEEIELNTGDSASHVRRSEKKFLIRSESDLDLVLPPANKPSLWVRLQWCYSGYGRWPKRTVYLKILGVGLAMCISYALIVLIVVKTLD